MNEHTTIIGLDAHKAEIYATVLFANGEELEGVRFSNTLPALRKFVRKLRKQTKSRLKACYEAGPLGNGLKRDLEKRDVEVDVIAPSLIPKKPGDRVKTDKRDATNLARLYDAGLLTVVHTPTEDEEAVRDLCRARGQAKEREKAAKHQLNKFLTRLGKRWHGTNWTGAHWKWIKEQEFVSGAAHFTYNYYVMEVQHLIEQVAVLDAKIAEFSQQEPYAEKVAMIRCFRGADTTTAMILVTELAGFERFESANHLMSYLGLVPSEYSSSGHCHRGSITKAGNSRVRKTLIEMAWHYRHYPRVGKRLRERRAGQLPSTVETADKAMRRLHGRFKAMQERRVPSQKIVVAIARELVGFLWAVLSGAAQRGEMRPLPAERGLDLFSRRVVGKSMGPSQTTVDRCATNLGALD